MRQEEHGFKGASKWDSFVEMKSGKAGESLPDQTYRRNHGASAGDGFYHQFFFQSKGEKERKGTTSTQEFYTPYSQNILSHAGHQNRHVIL